MGKTIRHLVRRNLPLVIIVVGVLAVAGCFWIAYALGGNAS